MKKLAGFVNFFLRHRLGSCSLKNTNKIDYHMVLNREIEIEEIFISNKQCKVCSGIAYFMREKESMTKVRFL
ncbi:hypothetical protein COBT_003246 [Conglomerata obtusa]